MKVDFLLVGRGIAGSALAVELIKAGKSVCCIENRGLSSSSIIAAGLFNPVVFKRTTLSWRAIEALDKAEKFYRWLEAETDNRFYYPTGLYRIFGTGHEANHWKKLHQANVYSGILGEVTHEKEKPWLNQPFGGAHIHGAGHVDTNGFIKAAGIFIGNKAEIIEETFLPEQITLTSEGIEYKNIKATNVIFCEGFLAEKNPWFRNLPFKTAKGEVLIIFSEELPNESFSGNVYAVPLGSGYFKIGSTYVWNQTNQNPTPEMLDYLKDRISHLIRVPFEITGHEAGIRPTVSDRRPLIGLHPMHKALGIFNGMGTKGILLAPLLASEFADSLINHRSVMKEYSIDRFEIKDDSYGSAER